MSATREEARQAALVMLSSLGWTLFREFLEDQAQVLQAGLARKRPQDAADAYQAMLTAQAQLRLLEKLAGLRPEDIVPFSDEERARQEAARQVRP